MIKESKEAALKELLDKYNIKPTKSLGQNFLIDYFALNCIIEALEIQYNDVIIEIGAGLGTMSKEIARRTENFIAVEIDKHLMPCLKDTLKEYEKVKIINTDFLQLDIEVEINNFPASCRQAVKIVGNLPYYITTPIIMKLLEAEINIDLMVFMVQKEAVDRMIAKPGTSRYGPLAVALQYFFQQEILFNVPPHCFYPKPKVSSTVVRFKRIKNPSYKVNNKKLFLEVVKASFEQRRKTIINSLSNSTGLKFLSLDRETIKNILDEAHIDSDLRGEALSLEQFVNLANTIDKYERH
ncbi:MAG TPA: 16S rRNA (adenine(1518)-N(6)/adenine(1519)-N(6))-dimethyltransferase RsmA [Clostridiaceae bacterium]|nr:16S rRNA (adenine(1518)-N(6)/adenine(1519)-N(6))-dimethyltransferase RsmA [Clostridiaceae bacterium]